MEGSVVVDEELAVIPALMFTATVLLLFVMSLRERERDGRVIAWLLLVPAFVSVTAALELLGPLSEETKVFLNAFARTLGTVYGLWVAWHWRSLR